MQFIAISCDFLRSLSLTPLGVPLLPESKGTAAKIKLASDPFLVSFFSHVSSGSSGFFAYFFMPSQILCAFLQVCALFFLAIKFDLLWSREGYNALSSFHTIITTPRLWHNIQQCNGENCSWSSRLSLGCCTYAPSSCFSFLGPNVHGFPRSFHFPASLLPCSKFLISAHHLFSVFSTRHTSYVWHAWGCTSDSVLATIPCSRSPCARYFSPDINLLMSTFFDVLDFFTIGSILAIEGLWDTAVNGPEIQPSLRAAPLPSEHLCLNVS